jgi:hypothetical protein
MRRCSRRRRRVRRRSRRRRPLLQGRRRWRRRCSLGRGRRRRRCSRLRGRRGRRRCRSRRRRRRRSCGPRRRGSRRRRRSGRLGRRGSGGRRRRGGTGAGRRWLLVLVLGIWLRRLRDDDRAVLRLGRQGLRLGRHACELHRREGGRGKQHEAEVLHDGLVPRKVLCAEGFGEAINCQPLGRIVAAPKRRKLFILTSQRLTSHDVHGSFRRCFQIESSMLSPAVC